MNHVVMAVPVAAVPLDDVHFDIGGGGIEPLRPVLEPEGRPRAKAGRKLHPCLEVAFLDREAFTLRIHRLEVA